jgi:hypothetical protein
MEQRFSAAFRLGLTTARKTALELDSLMPSGGVIFSDGVEEDFLQFNSGSSVVVRAAAETVQLVAG